MKKMFVYSLMLLAAVVVIPQASADQRKDCKFLEKASNGALLWNLVGSLAETNSTNFTLPPGGLSQTNSTNAAVQGLGSLLATNHSLAFSNIAVLQETNGCDISDEITKKQEKELRKLAHLTGPKFDQAFLKFVIEETTDAIDDYREAALNAKSAEVRAYARGALVGLTEQLVAALEAGEAVFGGDFDDIDCD
jgi:putative membrane protein